MDKCPHFGTEIALNSIHGQDAYYCGVCKDWFYSKDRVQIDEEIRPCSVCNKKRSDNDHDPCISDLTGGVTNACCGHGNNSEAYVQRGVDNVLRGEEAIAFFRKQNKGPSS